MTTTISFSSLLAVNHMDPFLMPLWFVPFWKWHFANWLQRSRNFFRCSTQKTRAHIEHGECGWKCSKSSLHRKILGQRRGKKLSKNSIDFVWHGQNICRVDEISCYHSSGSLFSIRWFFHISYLFVCFVGFVLYGRSVGDRSPFNAVHKYSAIGCVRFVLSQISWKDVTREQK